MTAPPCRIGEWLTPAAVTEMLGTDGVDVAEVSSMPVGNGLMATTRRLQVRFSGECALPPSYILKTAGSSEAARRTGRLGYGFADRMGFYESEVCFYEEVAPHSEMRVPRCWYAEVGDGGEQFTLLLDDLAAARPGDDLAGCDLREAWDAAANLAALHAPFWDGDGTPGPRWSCIAAVEGEIYGRQASRNVEAVLAALGDRLDAVERTVLEKFAESADRWFVADGRHHTITHNDFRLDNMLFGPDGVSTVVDWQTAMRASPGRDIGMLLGASLPDTIWRDSLVSVVDAYYEALVRHGVTGFSRADCDDEWRWGLFQALHNAIVTARAVELSERGVQMVERWLRRSCRRITEAGALTVLRSAC